MEEDALLWQRFRDGDRTAFESLVKTYYRPLFDYGIKFTSDRDILKDYVHDLFTTLWDRHALLGPTDHIKPYLLKSIRNRIFKEKQRANVFLEIDDLPDESFVVQEDIEMAIISEEFSDEKKRRINHILSKLTRRQKEIIHLKFYQNLSNDQIAEILAISRPAVANLLYHTLKLFREKWELLLYSLIAFLSSL